MMCDAAPLQLALRVLGAISVQFTAPSPEDISQLRGCGQTEAERSLPLDDLARLIVNRECDIKPFRPVRSWLTEHKPDSEASSSSTLSTGYHSQAGRTAERPHGL